MNSTSRSVKKVRFLESRWKIAILSIVALTYISILRTPCATPVNGSLTQSRETLATFSNPLLYDFEIETGEDWDELAEITADNMSQYDVWGTGSIVVWVTSGVKYVANQILWKDDNLPLIIYGAQEAVIDIAENYVPPFAGGLLSNMKLGNPVITWYPGVTIEVHDLTIRNTRASQEGGAIYARDSTVKVWRCTFENTNTSSEGGAICVDDSTLDVSSSIFENTSASRGGAICAWGSTMEISDCNFENTSALGGAVFAAYSTMGIIDCTFENLSASRGGAIYASADSAVEILNCTFRESMGSSSNAIYARDSTLEISGNVFSSVRGDSLVSSSGSQGSFENNEIVDDETDKLVGINPQFSYEGNTVDGETAKFDLLMDEYDENEGVIITSDKWYNDKGLLLVGGIFTVKDMAFQNTSIDGYGGAISAIGSSDVAVPDCSFENISASLGGAIYAVGSSTVEVSNCSFENTSAPLGGAMFATGDSNVAISNCSFWRTSAESGGAIYASWSTVRVSASAFKDTGASSKGGAIYARDYATVWVESSDFVECLDQDNKTFYTYEDPYRTDNSQINTVGHDENTPNAHVVEQGVNLAEMYGIYPSIKGEVYLSEEPFTGEPSEEPKFPIWAAVAMIGIAGVTAALVLKARKKLFF